jgi:ribonucleoside-diphosphate reductase alpha chain
MNVIKDYSRDALLDNYAIRILKDRYMVPGETSPQDAFARAAIAFADDEVHAQRLYDHVSQLHFMYSTPVLANGGTTRGLPISCFLQDTPDSRGGILEHYNESGWLASFGGGLGANWSKLRTNKTATSSGGESTGAIPFLSVMDRVVLAFRQAGTRRAAYAAYLDISHPEIVEFINIRKPTGGAAERKSLNIHNAINISDAFMEKLYSEDDSWNLLDPHSGAVTDTVSARALWEQIITMRSETGEPYLHFIDTSNAALPEAQKALGLKINNSNLCSEITLATGEDRTAVCCLSSVNLEKYDEWKDTSMVSDLVRMLDNVLTVFIHADNIRPSAKHSINKAIYSASRERSLGLGAMGFHSYLQAKMIPFESEEAKEINAEMFNYIRTKAELATESLGIVKGSCPDYIEGNTRYVYPRRNMHLLAIAPNASSSILCGNTSPSIEPYSAVSFNQKTENGTHTFKNKHFLELLKSKGLDDKQITSVWKSVGAKKGSVQHLDILTDHEKAVFKTAFEIDQHKIIELAADRQKYIDQAQSLNLFFAAPVDVKYLHDVHYSAWVKKLKTLYYMRTKTESSVENIGEKVARKNLVSSSLTDDKESAKTEEWKQTQFSTVTATGFEINCVGCEG